MSFWLVPVFNTLQTKMMWPVERNESILFFYLLKKNFQTIHKVLNSFILDNKNKINISNEYVTMGWINRLILSNLLCIKEHKEAKQ